MPSIQSKMVSGLFKMLRVNKMLDKKGIDFEKLLVTVQEKQKKPLRIPYKKMDGFDIDTRDIDGMGHKKNPIAQQVVDECRKRQKELGIINPYIFSIRPGEPLPERPIADLYKKYCKKLGIVQKSSHKMRKTFVSALIDEGMKEIH